jgi:hypothetical protein
MKKMIAAIVLGCVASLGVIGCHGEGPGDSSALAMPDQEPLTVVPASAEMTAATKGVVSWKVFGGEDPLFVDTFGVDARGQVMLRSAMRAEILDNGDFDGVTVESDFPDVGTLRIAKDRTVFENTFEEQEAAARIFTGLFEDFDRFTKHTIANPEAHSPDEPAEPMQPEYAPQALNYYTINSTDTIQMGWNMFGYSFDIQMGHGCDNGFTRTTYGTMVYNGVGSCYVKDWSTSSGYDCRVILHIGQAGGKVGTCNLTVYRWGSTN